MSTTRKAFLSASALFQAAWVGSQPPAPVSESRFRAMNYYLDPRRPALYQVRNFDPDHHAYDLRVAWDAPSICFLPVRMDPREVVLIDGRLEPPPQGGPVDPIPLQPGGTRMIITTGRAPDGSETEYVFHVTRAWPP